MKTSPEQIYGQLYIDVQSGQVFSDGKTFSDAIALRDSDKILQEYEEQKGESGFDLKEFVLANFSLPEAVNSGFKTDESHTILDHIDRLWDVLERAPDDHHQHEHSSLIPLPYPYIVPGGRFNEIYYWDSYFTMLGLSVSGKKTMIESMVKNFAWMIDQLGFIPNGNRSYYLTRSQPPFFVQMVALLEQITDFYHISKFVPALEREYRYWMHPSRVINIGSYSFNRYWDASDTARGEMLGDDLHLLRQSTQEESSLFRHVRAACESGWDFSSRWMDETQQLSTIRTTYILPVDLNCLLYQLEQYLAHCHQQMGNEVESERYAHLAKHRKAGIQEHFWSEQSHFFVDISVDGTQLSSTLSLAGVYPLYANIATQSQAEQVADLLGAKFLKPGGWVTTLAKTGQQWDAPNGWAPLQWIVYQGLSNYGRSQLASEGRDRWLRLCEDVFSMTGKMLEKYNVVNTQLKTGGGEYPVQDGFGWTNGVYLALQQDK